jgi:hypothetical protein
LHGPFLNVRYWPLADIANLPIKFRYWRCQLALKKCHACSHTYKVLTLIGGHEAVENLVDLVPRFQLLHVVEPAFDIGIGREVATDQLSDRHDCGAEIVGNGDFAAAKILIFGPDPVVVENLQPVLRTLLSPSDCTAVSLLASALVVWKELRIDQPITEVAVELGVESVHHLVDFGALL